VLKPETEGFEPSFTVVLKNEAAAEHPVPVITSVTPVTADPLS
jgi:hypothetical protein